MKTAFYIEYMGKQLSEKGIIDKIKELWVSDGFKIKDIKTLNIYIKPEEAMAYYVINDEISGKLSI